MIFIETEFLVRYLKPGIVGNRTNNAQDPILINVFLGWYRGKYQIEMSIIAPGKKLGFKDSEQLTEFFNEFVDPEEHDVILFPKTKIYDMF